MKSLHASSTFVFIVLIAFIFIPLNWLQVVILILTWFTMLTGFLDDNSVNSWGEYRKAILDLILSITASVALFYGTKNQVGQVEFWLPFTSKTVEIAPWLFITISTIMIWASINTTNCTDGVDGLSSTLVLVGLITLGSIFYFILGHTDIAEYLLVPHLEDGASWAVIIFTYFRSVDR